MSQCQAEVIAASTCKQCGMDGGRHKLQCSYGGGGGLALPAVRITHRPSGSQCQHCANLARDCSGLRFAAMRPAGRPDPDGVQRVACDGYVREGG